MYAESSLLCRTKPRAERAEDRKYLALIEHKPNGVTFKGEDLRAPRIFP
jgi:hypothetical protein